MNTDTPIFWRRYGPAAASAALAFALYAVTLGGTYIYDDVLLALEDPRLTDPARWGEYWTKGFFIDGADHLYRPLVSMTFALQQYLHGDRPSVFHLVNLLLYAAGTALVAELARRLTSTRAAYVAGLLFAALPVHVEAVASIVGRAELLSTLAILGGLLLYVRRPLTAWRAVGILACYVVAVLSKEQGLLLPLFLLAWALVRRWDDGAARRGSSRFRLLPPDRIARGLVLAFLWLTAGYLLWRERILPMAWDRNMLDPMIQPMVRSHGIDRWLMPLVLLGHYAQLLFVPWRLSIDYGGLVIGSQVSLRDPYLYLGFGAAVAWLVWFFLAWRRRQVVAVFCLLGLGLSYGMVGNIVTIIGTNLGERLMYLPSVFLLILIASVLVRLPLPALVATVAVLLALASARTVSYAAEWNERLAFYHDSRLRQPGSVRLHILEAFELMRLDRLDEAATLLDEARRLTPGCSDAWTMSAKVALKRNDLDAAQRYLDRAFWLVRNPMALQSMYDDLARRRAATRPSPAASELVPQ